MAIIHCDMCQRDIDDDYYPCEESPLNGELVCPDCLMDQEEEIEKKELDGMRREAQDLIIKHCKRFGQ